MARGDALKTTISRWRKSEMSDHMDEPDLHRLQDPVCEAFAEIVRSVREEGLEAIDNIEAVLDRDAKSSLAIACYRLAYGLIEGDGVADEDGSDAATQASVSVDEQAEDAKTR